ncbi:hypothetical protein D3C86_2256390 [compost metagenome]
MLGWIVVWALLSRLHPQRQFLHDVLAGTRLVHDVPGEALARQKRLKRRKADGLA